MLRVGPALAMIVIAVAVGFCLLTSSDVSLAVAQPTPPTIQSNVLVDQQVLDLELEPGIGSPEIDQTRAMGLAAAYLGASAHPTSVRAEYARLTLRDASGQVAAGIQARPAWLVTFEGVAYQPGGSSASVCSCTVVYQRPSTVVALDAGTARLIALVGTAN